MLIKVCLLCKMQLGILVLDGASAYNRPFEEPFDPS